MTLEAYKFLREPARLAPGTILNVVTGYYGLQKEDITGPSARREISRARDVTMYFMRELTPLTFQEIARELGRNHHQPVILGHRKIDNLLKANDEELVEEVTTMRESLEAAVQPTYHPH